jgi:hypothetical protein
VRLTPITSVSREYVREAMETGDWSSQVLARDRAVVWSTRTDEQGRFWFNQLPSGDYYINRARRLDRLGRSPPDDHPGRRGPT